MCYLFYMLEKPFSACLLDLRPVLLRRALNVLFKHSLFTTVVPLVEAQTRPSAMPVLLLSPGSLETENQLLFVLPKTQCVRVYVFLDFCWLAE